MANPYVRIDRVSKRYGDALAVNNVSLDINQGEIFCLLGGSGCGKTTLLRMLAGFEAPSSGALYIDGENLADIPPYERPVNMMFQSYALFPHMSVAANVAFGLEQERLALSGGSMPALPALPSLAGDTEEKNAEDATDVVRLDDL